MLGSYRKNGPILYTQPLVRARKQQQCAERSIRYEENKDVTKAHQISPFGYAEPLPRNPLNRLKYRGSFHAFLGVVSPFRAALRSPFSALSSFADSQNVHLSGRHQTVLSFGLTRCLAAVASWLISSFRDWFVRWLAQVVLDRQRDVFAYPKHLDSK